MDAQDLLQLLYNACTKAGVDEASTVVIEENVHMTRFSENQITISENWDAVKAIAYLIKDHKRAAFMLEDLAPERMHDAIDAALAWMKRTEKPEVEVTLPEGPFTYGNVENSYDPRIPRLDTELPDIVDEAVNASLSEKAKKASGVLRVQEHSRLIKTSGGCEGVERGTYLEFTIRAFHSDDASGHENWCGSTRDGFDAEALGSTAGRVAYQARNPSEGKPGVYNVILAPSVMGNLLNAIALSSSAYMAEVGLSCLGDKVGQQVASGDLTLIDDARTPTSPGISLFDDEGSPTEPVEIIKDGILQTLLHSSYTMRKRKEGRLTGNAYYSLFGEVAPVPRCLFVKPGAASGDELVKELGKGLYITNTWYTRFQNYITGDFSTIPRDAIFTVERGEISGSVKGLRISDNLLHLLKEVRALSRERVWRRWWEVDTPIFLPSFLVENISITKSTM